ncbi:MAG: biopolymer transporter ExbD [Prevotella sp.]|nr:biopolymer transporter ExbD [Prevotella sp.]
MFRRRHREQIPELNTSSTADISFMLLIFFLVTSSMDTDKGLLRQLPPPPQEETPPTDINQEHILSITLDANDQLACDGVLLTPAQLTEQVVSFVANDPQEHVLSIQTDRQTTYEAYYRMQNAIVAAYNRLRAGGGDYPMRISESKPQEGGKP